MTVELVQRTLNKAMESQNYPEAVMLHSDQRSQYRQLAKVKEERDILKKVLTIFAEKKM